VISPIVCYSVELSQNYECVGFCVEWRLVQQLWGCFDVLLLVQLFTGLVALLLVQALVAHDSLGRYCPPPVVLGTFLLFFISFVFVITS